MHNVIERYVSSEERYVTYDFTNDLATGETIVSASWVVSDPICQYVGGSSAVEAGGKMVSAKFRHLGEGDAVVTVTVSTTGVTEVISADVLFKQISVPGVDVPEGVIPTPPYERLFYVTAYGADPDGQQDSTIAIRNAMAAAYAAGGGTVFFPRGTYLFSTGALLDPGTGYSCVWITYDNVRWRGEGIDLSILKLMDNQPAYKAIITSHSSGADNLELSGLTIDQNFTNNTHNGSDVLTYYRMAVAILAGDNVHIHDCRFTDYSSINCVVVNSATIKGAKIRNNTFDNYGGATGEHDHSGIYSHNQDCLIEGNRFEGIAGGKGVVCAIEIHGDRQRVLHNTFKQVHTGVNLTGIASSSIGSIVAHNTIEDCRFGIRLYSDSTGGSTVGLEQVIISQNTIILNPDMWYDIFNDGAYAQGIALAGGWDLPARDIIIAENIIKLKAFTSPTIAADNDGSAIAFYDPLPNGVQHQHIKIINNTIDGAMAAGIRVTMDVLDFEMAGNQIRNVGQAANVNSGYKCGIFVTGPSAKYGRVHDNIILDDQATPTTANAIYFLSDSVTECECVDNRTFTVNLGMGHIYGGDAYAKTWLIQHKVPSYSAPAYRARPGSIITDLATGKQYMQVDSTNGNVWVPVSPNNGLSLIDGLTAPATVAGYAQIYVDTADGDLKVKFGDGTVKTIVVDT